MNLLGLMKARLEHRKQDLEAQRNISSLPPVVVGCALVLPRGLVDAGGDMKAEFSADAAARREVELRAMAAVTAAELALGNSTKDVSDRNCGWDITSTTPAGVMRHPEVKGRHMDAETVTVTANEILEAPNQGDKYILAIVRVDGAQLVGPHYVRSPFTKEPEGSAVLINYALKDLLARAKAPASA